ncbi:MAG: glycoside hydrolase family 2 protein, partial [Lachnospiraceae bacterium]|nr:glycoside hydrolase family 2 protein [Lachnospiraceae bacterium]
MKKVDFNKDWKFVKGCIPSLKVLQMYGTEAEEICLPHDAMIHEMRDENTKNGGATGFYPGGTYTYFKTFFVPAEWENKSVMLEFEGVYQTAMVYLNGVLVQTNQYGYSNFYADLTRYLQLEAENEVKVVADNASEQNSRWYTGSGIYRSVNLYVGEQVQIPVDGVRVMTKDADHGVAVVAFSTKIQNLSRNKKKLTVSVKLTDDDGNLFSDEIHLTSFAGSENKVHQQITIPTPRLWNCDTPNLYQCVVQVSDEERLWDEEKFYYGIRKVSLDAVRGLQINGETVKLRGTCVHHDNGILGAATHEAAELRKCELIKAAGFNSVRCAHNPADKAFLNACDKVGLLVMDELIDMWTNHKNNNDFAFYFLEEWQDIVRRMVAKDYNHPSVILYSVGNEIPEIGTERGAEINRMLCNYFRELDDTRFTTNGMNALNAAGAKIYPILQELAPLMNRNADGSGTNDSSGSNAMNSFMKLMEGEAGDSFAVHPIVTEVLRESSESMDIIGLNYLTGRHLLDGKLYPNKCVLGTETFPADIARLWKVVCSSNQVLGDFTWTGYDYLGEAGCGIFYYDERSNFG